MAVVRTLSQQFLSDHPRAGEPTYFVEQFLNSLGIDYTSQEYLDLLLDLNTSKKRAAAFWRHLTPGITGVKSHTIRSGQHFIKGDSVSIRVWADQPYRSTQIILAPVLQIKREWSFTASMGMYFIEGNYVGNDLLPLLANRDGLTVENFEAWFALPFDGQILCWNDQNGAINYNEFSHIKEGGIII